MPGGVTQVREVASAVIQQAKRDNIATLLVGHVTKDGSVAGPRVLEHLVDVVLQFEGDRNSRLRLLRAVKNRFGPVDEIGCFDLVDDGIVEVPDPTGSVRLPPRAARARHLRDRDDGGPPAAAGRGAGPDGQVPRRPPASSSGLDSPRVAMILAVLTKHCGSTCPSTTSTPRRSAAHGSSSRPSTWRWRSRPHRPSWGRRAPADLVAIGEVGLAGEVRKVSNLIARLREAERIGFRRALVPAGSTGLDGLDVDGDHGCRTIDAAMGCLDVTALY